MAKPQIDPALTEHLAQHAGNVEVVVTLRRPRSNKPVSDDVRALAERVLDETTQACGVAATAHNVLANLGVLIVDAPAAFVSHLIRHASVTTAAMNRPPE
jgi:hypothetical protein